MASWTRRTDSQNTALNSIISAGALNVFLSLAANEQNGLHAATVP